MKRFLSALWRALSSRAVPPLVLGFFFLAYIAIAFFTDEALITLAGLTGKSLLLAGILALIPLNSACRIAAELRGYFRGRRALGGSAPVDAGAYDEIVEVPASAPVEALRERLAQEGYRTRVAPDSVGAWRGISLAPARIVFLAATFCLFGGIVISLQTRTVTRQSVIEGGEFPTPYGPDGTVDSIVFRPSTGAILAKELIMAVSPGPGGAQRQFGIYPPALYRGAFVYPRYLGVAVGFRFSAPDLAGYEHGDVYPIYPPGKEASSLIPGSPYKITFTLAKPADGSDPYMTGRMSFAFKVLKGQDLVFSGTAPSGGELAKDGYRLAFPESRRMVITDMVVDYGVVLIWGAGILFSIGIVIWLPLRLLFPRREMIFRRRGELVDGYSRAEGRERAHAGAFHDMLDYLAGKNATFSAE